MAPKVTQQIMQNMQKEGLLNVPQKDYNDKKARAAWNLKFKEILARRTRNLVNILPTFVITSCIDLILFCR
jgi:hypothetical protein